MNPKQKCKYTRYAWTHIPYVVVLCWCQMTSVWAVPWGTPGCMSAFPQETGQEGGREGGEGLAVSKLSSQCGAAKWLQKPSRPRIDTYSGVPQCRNSPCACYETAVVQFTRHPLGTRLGPVSWWPHSLLMWCLSQKKEVKGTKAENKTISFLLF